MTNGHVEDSSSGKAIDLFRASQTSTAAEIACFNGKPAAFKRAPLKMFRCEPCDDNAGNAWYRIWTARNSGWACADVSLDLGRRMMDQLADRYGIADRAGLYTGRMFIV